MSTLFVHSDQAPDRPSEVTLDGERIAELLRPIGVRFERWSADQGLSPQADQAEILAAYAGPIARLCAAGGYRSSDVVRVRRGTPGTAQARAKFLREHRHAEDEVRFFVEGSGSFYLHTGGHVYHLLCERNDLISVPVNTPHWFDMGTDPEFCAIRLFTDPAGWVAQFTGDEIAARFGTHDEALATSLRLAAGARGESDTSTATSPVGSQRA